MPSFCLRFLLTVAVGYQAALSWPVSYELNADTLPNLEVSLAPPQDPFPSEAMAVRQQEELHERINVARMNGLQRASRKVLLNARASASRIIGNMMHMGGNAPAISNGAPDHASTSFLDERTDALSDDGIAVHIDVASSSTADKTWTDDIIAIGNTTANAAQRAYEQDVSDMQSMSETMLRELEVQLHAQLDTSNGVLATTHRTPTPNVAKAAFVSMLGEENIRVVPSSQPFPEAASFVQAMGSRAMILDHLARWKVLEIDAQLLKAQRRIIGELLDDAVSRVKASSP